jgi:hypothetical protein
MVRRHQSGSEPTDRGPPPDRADQAVNSMELAFATQELRSLCEDMHVAAQALEAEVVDQLKARLADLRAANAADDLLVASPELVLGSAPTVTVELARGWVMVIQPNHRRVPEGDTGGIDWTRVRRVRVLEITRPRLA